MITKNEFVMLYDRSGLTILPLAKNSKRPKFSNWTQIAKDELLNGFNDGDNIGIRIELPLFVIDVDDARLGRLIEDAAPSTWIVKTRRGLHFYFRAKDYYPKTNKRSRLIQLLAEGCQVVAPPSRVDGHEYRFLVNPRETPIAELDENSVKFLEAIIEAVAKHEKIILEFSRHWNEGHRHNLSLWMNGALRKSGIPRFEAAVIVKSICLLAGDPELNDRLRALDDTYKKPFDQIAAWSKLREELSLIVGHEGAGRLLALLPSPPVDHEHLDHEHREEHQEKKSRRYLLGGEILGGRYLVEIVEVDGAPKLLVYDPETGGLGIHEAFEHDGVAYQPYPDLPFKLPGAPERIDVDPTLWRDTVEFIGEYYDNPRGEEVYHVMTAGVAWSYFYRDVKASTPFLLYLGPWRSGKTRALEVMAALCHRAMAIVDPSEASIFRLIEELRPTLIIDEAQIMDKNVRAIMAAAYRYGMKVPRVIDPEEEGLDGIRWYNVFSFIIYASREEPPNDIFSRSITIHCEKNTRPTRKLIDEERAKQLRTRWLAQRIRLHGRLKITFDEFASEDGRLQELFSPLLVMAQTFGDEEAAQAILRYGRLVEQEIHSMEATSDDALILEAMLAAINSGQNDAPEYVTVREIVERLNEGLEKEAYTPAYVGRRLSALGFRRKRIHGGHVAYIVDMDLLQRLASRYNMTMDMVLA